MYQNVHPLSSCFVIWSVSWLACRSVRLLLSTQTHFPWIEADWINNCWLSNLFSRKYSPCDSDRGKPICIGHINWALKHSQHKCLVVKIFAVFKKTSIFAKYDPLELKSNECMWTTGSSAELNSPHSLQHGSWPVDTHLKLQVRHQQLPYRWRTPDMPAMENKHWVNANETT